MGRKYPLQGRRGKDNGPADVMLVQALFRYIATMSTRDIMMQAGLTDSDLPQANGKWDAKTSFAIWRFQQANAQKLISVDGQIHPATYDGRVINSEFTDYMYQKKATPIMTITLLHVYAWVSETTMGNYFSSLVAIAPDLKPWLI